MNVRSTSIVLPRGQTRRLEASIAHYEIMFHKKLQYITRQHDVFTTKCLISDRHILIGSDEGIYTLNISQNDKEMEQVSTNLFLDMTVFEVQEVSYL